MRRTFLRVWASDGAVTDPDLDDGHPGGTGGPDKYIDGWIVEKEPHQWANFIYKSQTEAQIDAAVHGVPEQSSIAYSTGALSWFNDEIQVLTPRGWETSFATLSLTEAEALKTSGRNLYNSHVPRRDRPHGETAVQIGSISNTGGTFTGEVFYRGGFQVGATQFKNFNTTTDVWFRSAAIQKGFATPSGRASYYTGAAMSELLLIDKLPEYELESGFLFATPEPDAYWPLKNSPYAELGKKTLIVSGGDQIPVFQKLGLRLEQTKTYLLEDMELLNYQGCVTAMVNGVGVIKNAPAVGNSRDLKIIFGSNVNVCDIRIWGYQLTAEQLASVLATFA